MKCTWKGCHNEGTHERIAVDDNRVWATLCDEHNKALDDALAGDNIPALLSAWVKASGGSDVLVSKMDSGGVAQKMAGVRANADF